MIRRTSLCRAATALAVLSAVGTVSVRSAIAQSPATATVTCNAPPTGFIKFGPSSQSLSCGAGASGSVGAQAEVSLPSLFASATGTDAGLQIPAGSNATLDYEFEVLAPANYDPTVKVPILTTLQLTTGVSGGGFLNHDSAYAYVVFDQSTTISQVVANVCTDSGYQTCGQTIVDNQQFNDVTGTFLNYVIPMWSHTVVVSAYVNLNSNAGTTLDEAEATADPFIQIDPAFLAANPGYSLVFSSNVTNAPPVPLPGAAWLLASGLFAAARLGRRAPRRFAA